MSSSTSASTSASASASLARLQALARGRLARERTAMLRKGRKAQRLCEANRKTLAAWVEKQAGKDPAKRTTLEVKAAKKLLDFQRKRMGQAPPATTTTDGGGGGGDDDDVDDNNPMRGVVAVRPWLPVGLDVKYLSGGRGRCLVATRSFTAGDLVLAEAPAVVAELDYPWLSDSPKEEEEENWKTMVRAVAEVKDRRTRERILRAMHHDPDPSPLLSLKLADFIKKNSAYFEYKNWLVPSDGKEKGKDKSGGGDGSSSSSSTTTTTTTTTSLPEQRTQSHGGAASNGSGGASGGASNPFARAQRGPFACLPILGSLLQHSCDANCVRLFEKGGGGPGTVDFIAARDIAAGEVLSVDYLGTDSLLWPRHKRREYLLDSKGFDCSCDRCALRPDRPRCVACPLCLPLEKRANGGFQLPSPPMALPPLASSSSKSSSGKVKDPKPFVLSVDDESIDLPDYNKCQPCKPHDNSSNNSSAADNDGDDWGDAAWSFGYMSQDASPAGTSSSSSSSSSSSLLSSSVVWRCSRKPSEHCLSTAELRAMELPQGGPAADYLALLEYCDRLGNDLDDADDDTLLAGYGDGGDGSGAGAEVHVAAVAATVGRRHWAAKVRSVRRLRCGVDASFILQQIELRRRGGGGGGQFGLAPIDDVAAAAIRLERLVLGLMGFVDQWLGLDSVRGIGPVALLRAAEALLAAGHAPAARAVFAAVKSFTAPHFKDAYTAASKGLLAASSASASKQR